MGYKTAAQVLKKAEPLKQKVTAKNQDVLNDIHVWTDQQQLQTIYHQVLVLDLEYALDKKVEQDLWTIGFKNHISMLQEQARDKKNVHRSEAQGLLSWCLEAASGFYLTLLQELCSTYDLDFPFRKRGALFGQFKGGCYEPNETLPQQSSCLYICQYCLVHLGDIARYRNQRQQAESFYKHAILVAPNSGHPYNQLALLEASQGDKLSTVYHYIRGIACKSPFPGATTNLINTLSLAMDKEDNLLDVQTKMTLNDFIGIFLKAHALLHTHSNLEQAEICVKSLNATLTALVATESFTKEQLIKITAINMFAFYHNGSNDLTADEKRSRDLALSLLAGSLSAFLLPVYTLKDDQSIVEYYALPAISLIMMWIKNRSDLLQEKEFTSRLQIWPGYCKLLNILSAHLDKKINFLNYEKTALSYDRELEGFLPLQETFNFVAKSYGKLEPSLENQIQAFRLMNYGKWLTTLDVNGSKLIICNIVENEEKFEPGCIQPDPTDKLLEEMKSFQISEIDSIKLRVPERKGGILKPQGSLEKSREERVKNSSAAEDQSPTVKVDPVKIKRATHNVALQSIYKKIEENKQVKFSNETNLDKSPTKTANSKSHPLNTFRNYPVVPANSSYPSTKMDRNDFYHQFVSPPHQLQQQQQHSLGGDSLNSFMQQPPIQKPPAHSMNYMDSKQGPPPFYSGPNTMPFNREERQRNWWPPPMVGNQPQQQQQQQHFGIGPQHESYNYRPPPNDYYMFNNYHGGGGGGNSNNLPPQQQQQHQQQQPQQRQELFGHWSNSGGLQAVNSAPPPMRPKMNDNMLMMSNQSQSNLNNAPGYSLFNTNSWSPSLQLPGGGASGASAVGGPLRSPATMSNVPMGHHLSLFSTSAAPQSLQQLVEQQKQQQIQKGDT